MPLLTEAISKEALSLRHLLKDWIVRYVTKEHLIGNIPVKEFVKNINYSPSYCKINETTVFATTKGFC